jgi:hypothetical protein
LRDNDHPDTNIRERLFFRASLTPVPLPAAGLLFSGGLAGLALAARKRAARN